jgi:hypothetical protein
MRLDLDTEIRFPNGRKAGVLQKAIVGEHGHVDSIVMSTAHFISHDVIVPVSALSEAPGEVLTLNMTPDQVKALPEYEEGLVPAAPEGWEWSEDAAPGSSVFPGIMGDPGMIPVTEQGNVPPGESTISQGTQIWCEGSRWGIVDEILLSDSGDIQAFIGRSDNTEEHDRIIPIELVSEYSPDAVTLSCTLRELPSYTEEFVDQFQEPDADL